MTGGRSAPSISYNPNIFDLTQNVAMSTVTPTVAGTVTSWSISPSLPTGLSLSSSTGISGTPTAISSTTNYTSQQPTPLVTIPLRSPSRSVNHSRYCLQSQFLHLVSWHRHDVGFTNPVRNRNSGFLLHFSFSPAGLSIGSTTGTIGGTPTAVSSSATYTITATNTAGSDTATITIVVNDVAPSSITYSPNTFTLTKGTAMTTVHPTTTGGTVTTWSVSPSLPSGLSLPRLTVPSVERPPPSLLQRPTPSQGPTPVEVRPRPSPSSSTMSPQSLAIRAVRSPLTKGTAMTTLNPTSTGGTLSPGLFLRHFQQA